MDEKNRLLIDQLWREIDLSKHVNAEEEFRAQLKNAIEELIRSDLPRLIQILYRLDVDEEKLKIELKKNTTAQHADVICKLIIERQLQKQHGKKPFGGNENISDDEKW